MDLAIQVEQTALSHQNQMNAVIDRGDSPIQQFYNGSSVFVTGGTEFLGKQFIEKLFRACNPKKLYVLLRSENGENIQDTLNTILQDPVYDLLRKKKPNFANSIVPVEGDVADVRLGLSEIDWATLTNEVDTIIHMAATVKFDEPIRIATLTNVRGTREMITLARGCKALKNFTFVSTAFSHATEERVNREVVEQFYPCPVPPGAMIELVEKVSESRLEAITPNLIKGWPNTYTFTKALAEELVKNAGDIPFCVVRPPIVLPCYYEPNPGWLDNTTLAGPSGIALGVGLGIVHVILVDKSKKLAFTPLDYVNNAIIAAGWDSEERRKGGDTKPAIYTVVDMEHCPKWNTMGKVLADEGVKLASPYTAWYCFLMGSSNKWIYFLLTWILHYIPAYTLDGVFSLFGKKAQGIKSFVDVYRDVDKKSFTYEFFETNEWNFRNHNVRSMLSRMTEADAAIFNCDTSTIDYAEYIKVWCIGLRKYILKDGLRDSEICYKRQKMFRILHYVIVILYFYVLWKAVYGVLYLGKYVLRVNKKYFVK